MYCSIGKPRLVRPKQIPAPKEFENILILYLQDINFFGRTAAAAKSRQSCPTPCDPIDGTQQAPLSLGFSRKNTRVGCHFLLQCMKLKSESEVAQSYPTLSDPMNFSLPCSSIHGILQARVLEWVGRCKPSL